MRTLKFLFVFIGTLLIVSSARGQSRAQCQKMIVEGAELMTKDEFAKSLELLTDAKTLAEDKHWHKQHFLALNNIGANYYKMLDYGEAMENYFQAYKVALKELDEKYEMIVLNNIALLYSKESKFHQSEDYFIKAYKLAQKNRDSLRIGLYAANLAQVYNAVHAPDRASEYLKIAIPLLDDSPSSQTEAKVARAKTLMLKGHYHAAKDSIERLLPKIEKLNLNKERIAAYRLLSKYYKTKNQYTAAIHYSQKALHAPKASLKNKIDAYKSLTSLYKLQEEYPKAFAYTDSVIRAKDSLHIIENGKQYKTNKIKFELQNYRKQLSDSRQQLTAERKTFFIIIGIAVIFLLILLWALRNYYIKSKQRKIISDRTQKITALELEKEQSDKMILKQQLKEQKTMALLEQERLKRELESKNRKLTTKALTISSRNELIEHIITAISKETKAFTNQQLKRQILALKNSLKKHSEWKEFFKHFDETNHGFLTALRKKHPELTSKDMRFLSYIYMNLSTKEISSLLNITVDACRKRKERIIKKLEIPEDINLYHYISAL